MMKYEARVQVVGGEIVVRTFVNTVGRVTWVRNDIGAYTATLPEAFGPDRVHFPTRVLDIDLEGEQSAIIGFGAPDKIVVNAQNSAGDHVEWLSYSVEFEVYPTSFLETHA